MAGRRYCKVIARQILSPTLEVVRLIPQDSKQFPSYVAGQFMTFTRENFKLTQKNVDEHGTTRYVADVDGHGHRRRGEVSHSYSIASAPFETHQYGFLELCAEIEMIELNRSTGTPESFFVDDAENDLSYEDEASGEFTLEKRAAGYSNVVFVAAGTGIAPLTSMIKQLHFEALQGKHFPVRYTLFYANRTAAELGFHNVFLGIEEEQRIDFVYVPTISRPTDHDADNPRIGKGRGNNILRSLFGMELKEENEHRDVQSTAVLGRGTKNAIKNVVQPVLPSHCSREFLLERMAPAHTVFLVCGNTRFMNDIEHIAERNRIRCEKEEW